jgi:hypothetical protein
LLEFTRELFPEERRKFGRGNKVGRPALTSAGAVLQHPFAKELSMKRSTLLTIAAAGLLLGSVTAFAQTDSPGASGYAPGQQDRTGTERGASSFAPGQRAKTEGGSAKDYAPGQRMKAAETTGSGKSSLKGKGSSKLSKDIKKKKH